MTTEELKEVLERHKHWLSEDCEGWENMKADLRFADLSYADLRYADLRNANLRYADLRYADLRNADLRYADLRYATLRNADLRYADLFNANLRVADLSYADLFNANLRYADLRNAGLRYATNVPFVWMSCPDTGAFVGWKKAGDYIVKLMIPEDARRSSATGRQCRCDKAVVLDIQNVDGTQANVTKVASDYNPAFVYMVGETVKATDFDTDRFNECAPGIHFFINRQEAVQY